MEIWNNLPPGEMELTIESEAYLELAKDDLSKCEYEDARKELEVAVRSVNPQAEYLLGYLYEHTLGVDWDIEKALLWYLRAAEHGYAPAQTAAAVLYINGDDVPEDYAEAYRLLTLAVQKEDPEAEFLLGLMYSEGFHVETDLEKAVCWMEKAAQKGYGAEVWAKKAVEYGETYPLVSVALRYIDGNATPQDIEKGVSLLTELADKGIVSAQMTLAERLITGKGIPKDRDRALRYLPLAAEAGYASLVSSLGVALYRGEGGNADPDMAVNCLELAARSGHAEALVELGNLYLDGAGEIPPDQEKAFRYFIEAAEKDNSRGWELAGYCLYEGKGTPQNRREALRWYEKAAKMNLYNSYYMMGMIYGYDNALFDYGKAVRCFEKSAELGQTDALVRLGMIYLNGLGDNQPNREKALQFYIKAAEKGSRNSQYRLGMIYGYDFAPPDYQKAARWFRKAAAQGHSDAQLKLGIYYHNGRGVTQNYEEAFALFEQAAVQGHATAMHNIGDAYENGYGVEKDDKQAFAWYMKSAGLNDKCGMFAAGRLLYHGIGTEQDREEGVRWINRAAEAGLREAIDWNP